MKHAREIKVGILAIIALFILYFGFNFLKGVNIFKSTNAYIGVYDRINGLVEQAPVYIKGYKVGQVDKITYDFSKDSSFTVTFSINKDIQLPEGTELALIADGLLGGTALQLNIPTQNVENYAKTMDTLPTIIVPGLVDNLQAGLLTSLSDAISNVDSLVITVKEQLSDDHLKNTLENIDQVTLDLTSISKDLKVVVRNDVPTIVSDAKDAIADVKIVTANLSQIHFDETINKVDSAVVQVNELMETVNSKDGTLGLLLNDKELYINLTNTVTSADELLEDLKAHPKRYVHFSIFGKKDK